MVAIIDKTNNKLRKYSRLWRFDLKPKKVVLHHTVSPNADGTARYLEGTKLAYHYMIEKSGAVKNYVDPGKYAVNHSKGNNRGTIGVAFVCGGKYGAVNSEQYNSAAKLLNYLSKKYPTILEITGHKDLSPKRKIDPRWPGEPSNGVIWGIHYRNMERLEFDTGLKYVK